MNPAPANPSPTGSTAGWMHRATSPAAAGVVLALFWGVLIAGNWNQSLTSDEIVHATAGYAYWRFNDYRLNPENGNLPQRIAALPLVFGGFAFPSRDSAAWRTSDQWELGDEWFHQSGNDPTAMLRRGRAAAAVQAVALAAVVWWWARRLFGATGGMLALLVGVLNPTLLAHGGLMTSDTACALFFFVATLTGWNLLHGLTWARVLASALAMAALFLSKMSAIVILPIALVLVLARLVRGGPLPVAIGRKRIEVQTRVGQATAFAAAGVVHIVVITALIWAAYGFRHRAFAGADADRAQHAASWAELAGPEPYEPAFQVLDFVRQHHWLPEAFVHGHAHALRGALGRAAFLNGEFSAQGWRTFFPYTFLVKTPLPFFGLMLLAAAAAWAARGADPKSGGRRSLWYDALPLWTLLLIYWAVAITSHLNIGHRHILATYPPLFVLCGAAAWWWQQPPRRGTRIAGWAAGALLAAQAAEITWRFPHHLAYFNPLAGGPAHAYRHLVDSSLDWGQDLPGVKRYLDRHPDAAPFFLSYFGTGSPASYGIAARMLYASPGRHRRATPSVRILDIPRDQYSLLGPHIVTDFPLHDAVGAADAGATMQVMLVLKPNELRLAAGTYLVSASMLQPLYYDPAAGPWGPWNERFERGYQTLRSTVAPLLADDAAARARALEAAGPDEWRRVLDLFDQYRFARLTAFLRQREPDDNIGFSILVYRLDAAALTQALDGPPPELGVDLPRQLQPPTAPPTSP